MHLLQLWPEEEFPLIEFGRMVLDTNVKNYYSEVRTAGKEHVRT
jgi:catalase